MEDKKIQTTRISEDDISLIKNTFKDNLELLKSVRNLFFGFELSADELKNLKSTFKEEKLRSLMRKFLLAEFSPDDPIGSSTDLWMSSIDGVKNVSPEMMYPIFISQKIWIEMLEKALGLLENPDGEKVSLVVDTEFKDAEKSYCNILARNTYVKSIEGGLLNLQRLAAEKVLTPEEEKKAKTANSSK